MIYLLFRGQIYYPGAALENLQKIYQDEETALAAMRTKVPEYEWEELWRIDPATGDTTRVAAAETLPRLHEDQY